MSPSVLLPADTGSPAAARALVRREMVHCDQDAVAAAELVISELVTNALVHARTSIEVQFGHEDDTVRAAVIDEGVGRPTRRAARASDEHGRGLGIVRSVADEWGVDDLAVGKAVWFTLRCRDAGLRPTPSGPGD
jgi:anti-sigma regulatory factor (Ser/Thr protein kinase)